MYRPGTDPHYRPRTVVPPPPPQGMMNYIPQRPLPPPIHGSPYSTPQFSYVSGPPPPPPPMTSQVPSFSSSGLGMQPPPLPPFVPPLPSDLPPPPPSSPPPSPPPLPSEGSLLSDLVLPQSAEDSKKKSPSSNLLPENRGFSDFKSRPGFHSVSQEKNLFEHVSVEAGIRTLRQVDSANKVLQPQQHSDWNSTYLDTLDDEGGSPATSDMDMDMEDAGQVDVTNTNMSIDGDVILSSRVSSQGPGGTPANILSEIHKIKEITFQGMGISDRNLNMQKHPFRDNDLGSTTHASGREDRSKMAPSSHLRPVKEIENSESIHKGRGHSSASAMPRTVDETPPSCSGIGNTFFEPEDHQGGRSSRWSPPYLQGMQVARESQKNDDLSSVIGGRENVGDSGKSLNSAEISMGTRVSNVATGIHTGASTKLEEQGSVGLAGDISTGHERPIKTYPAPHQQEQKKGPTMDEFGRLAQAADSDSEPDGSKHPLPIDEFGRVVQKGASGSDSEGARRPSKRKRSYSRSGSSSKSRSRSRSRSRSKDTGRVRNRSRNRGRSRSRSRSWSSRSRSRSRSRSSRSISRSRSRSRNRSSSRSPAKSSGRRRRSYSRSPRRKMRWSRSRSRSPEWRRSYSRTPPRDLRWNSMGRGDRDWRGDREYFGRGRRGGRGGGPNPCYHYARGRCFRGSSCRYLHVSREIGAQDRGAWRRDTQLERPTPDATREDYPGDQHNRGPWRRDLRMDRSDDFGGASQDYMGERPKKEFVSVSSVPQEDFGREPSFSRPIMPFSQGELWPSRNADEAKDRQVMAYNKALELVGIAHTEDVVIHDEVQVDYSRTVLRKETIPDATGVTMEAHREFLLAKSADAGNEIQKFEGTTGIGLVDSSNKENPMVTNETVTEVEFNDSRKEPKTILHLDKTGQDANIDLKTVENTRLEKEQIDGDADGRDMLEQHASREILLLIDKNAGNVLEGLEDCDTSRDSKVCNVMSSSIDSANDPSRATVELIELCAPVKQAVKQELRSDIDFIDTNLGGLNAAGELEPVTDIDLLEKDTLTLGDVLEQSKVEVLKNPEAASAFNTVVSSEEGIKQDLEVTGKLDVHSVDEVEQTDALKVSDSVAEKVCTSVAASIEMPMSHVNSSPLLAPSQQHAAICHAGSDPGILPSPDVQQHGNAGQPISAPGLLTPIPPQGQHQASTYQPFAQSCPSSSMPCATSAGDISRGAQYSAYRMPLNRPVTSPQTFDQAARPVAKFNSGNTGYSSAGGWGQTSFQPRAPTQEALALNQVHGLPNYGTASRPSPGPSTSGAPFYGAPNQGDKFAHHHGAPYSADQFSQHHRAPNTGDQFSQLQRPPNAGGFGHSNPGGYGPAYSGGFGQPNSSGPFLQHHVSSNPGAPFSQQQVAPNPGCPFPQSLPAQSHGPIFPSQPIAQNFGQSNQPYGSAFPGQNFPGSTQQPGGPANQFLNSPGSPLFAQPQLATAQQGQQGFSSSTSFLSEQSQPLRPFAGVTVNQVMQPSIVNTGLSANSAFPTSLSGQTIGQWNFQSLQNSGIPPPGQPPAYSYPLTTIPPLSGLTQVPQATSLPAQNDHYDPLSDVTGLGLGGAPKVAGASGAEKTNIAGHKENVGQDVDPGKTRNPVSRLEATEADTKTTGEDVGVVENLSPENWSPGPPADDIETGKGQALSKKSSRGLKMLRTAIADHVKEVLKPTWKEGYMSKEAFKTIAKKAVEKVVGNLPSHHIPKSQEKVDQYMRTSRPKISKLVQGYVDKYLKL
ncbi:hypothetical protein L7F22_012276 [Adiantum nelumboides]|nr:hypothetical protein [Adiantum nelumboides]